MKRWPTMEMHVVGYADSEGYPEYNMELAQKYAETVRDFLVLQGIDSEKITLESKGNSELLTEDAAHRDLNRRVEIHMSFPKRFGIF